MLILTPVVEMTGNHVLPNHIVGLVLGQGLIFIDGRRKEGRMDKNKDGRKETGIFNLCQE